MEFSELELLIDLPETRIRRVLAELHIDQTGGNGRLTVRLLERIERHDDVLRSTIVPSHGFPWSVPPTTFLSLAPYQHFDFTVQLIRLWQEMSRAVQALLPLYIHVLGGALLEGLLLLGLHGIQQGPNLFESPATVATKTQGDYFTLSWMIQLAAVNRMFNNGTRQAFHRIRELRNDVHFVSRRDRNDPEQDLQDAEFVIQTLAGFVPELKTWMKRKRAEVR